MSYFLVHRSAQACWSCHSRRTNPVPIEDHLSDGWRLWSVASFLSCSSESGRWPCLSFGRPWYVVFSSLRWKALSILSIYGQMQFMSHICNLSFTFRGVDMYLPVIFLPLQTSEFLLSLLINTVVHCLRRPWVLLALHLPRNPPNWSTKKPSLSSQLSCLWGEPEYTTDSSCSLVQFCSTTLRLTVQLLHVMTATWCDNHKILPPLLSMLEASPGPVSSMLPFLLSSTLGKS